MGIRHAVGIALVVWLTGSASGQTLLADPPPKPTADDWADLRQTLKDRGATFQLVNDSRYGGRVCVITPKRNGVDDDLIQLPQPRYPHVLRFDRTRFTERALHNLGGEGFVAVTMSRRDLCDATIQMMAKNDILDKLGFVTDVAGRQPRSADDIHTFDLSGTRITDASLETLAAVPSVRAVLLADTVCTDRGLARLAALKHLTHLDLSNTEVTNNGLGALARLKKLDTLILTGTRMNDAVASDFGGLTELVSLNLSRTSVNGKALDQVAKLGKLERLDLSETGVTDEDVAKFADHPTLMVIDMADTKTTAEGRKQVWDRLKANRDKSRSPTGK